MSNRTGDLSAAPAHDRIESLDVLRGVAILGIFAVNIVGFGLPWFALSNPTAVPGFFDDNAAFWWTVSTSLFQFKFITLFSVLFGAGIILMLGEESPSARQRLHRSRMFWLFLIGMAHCYFLWFGDILAPYALAGFLVSGARVWRSSKLLLVGAILITLNFGLFFLQDWGLQFMSAEELAEMNAEMWAPPPEKVAEIIATYRSGFLDRLPSTIEQSFLAQMVQGVFLAPRTIGLMMIGIALYKTGFLTLHWTQPAYIGLGLVATVMGFFGSYWAATHSIHVGFEMTASFPGQAALYWASLLQAFGYAALVMTACKIDILRWARVPFAAAGRMALSNYLLSTLIGVGIFYGPPGLAQIGAMSAPQLAGVVAGVWGALLIWSPLWLAVFRFGPAEWIWRTLTYGKAQTFLK